MSGIDHSWTQHACNRLDQASGAATGLRIAVEGRGAHLWADRRGQIAQAIADLQAVQTIIEQRIADEPVIVPRAA